MVTDMFGPCYFCDKPVYDRVYRGQPTFMQILEGENRYIAHRDCVDKKADRLSGKATLGVENGLPTLKLEVNF